LLAADDAASDGEVGEALVVGDDVEGIDEFVGSAVGELLPAQPVTAANTSAPVAQDFNPSRFLMCGSMLPLAFRLEAQTAYRGRRDASSEPSS
jgi:hypothetical protein